MACRLLCGKRRRRTTAAGDVDDLLARALTHASFKRIRRARSVKIEGGKYACINVSHNEPRDSGRLDRGLACRSHLGVRQRHTDWDAKAIDAVAPLASAPPPPY